MEDRRNRKGLYWVMEGPHGTLVEGFQPDGLATKTLEDVESLKEMVFVSIRGVLETNDTKCMDSEDDRLDLCEKITNWVYQNRRKII